MTLNEELVKLRQQVKELDKENRRLKKENDFLEEAGAFFAASRLKSVKTKELFRNYSDFFQEKNVNGEMGIELKEEITIEKLIVQFRGYLALDVLMAFVNENFVQALGVFHLGEIASSQVTAEIEKKYQCDFDIKRISDIFMIACLLHNRDNYIFAKSIISDSIWEMVL